MMIRSSPVTLKKLSFKIDQKMCNFSLNLCIMDSNDRYHTHKEIVQDFRGITSAAGIWKRSKCYRIFREVPGTAALSLSLEPQE
jgi:hypothetical protein